MSVQTQSTLIEIEQQVCDVASEQLAIRRSEVSPSSRIIQDLNCDSLDLVDLIMEIEERFNVCIPDKPPNAVYKSVFTRQPFRLSDLAELVYLQRGTGTPERRGWRRIQPNPPPTSALPFSQLGGRWQRPTNDQKLFEVLGTTGQSTQFRRSSDGMRCILIPSAEVEIGCDLPDALPDEKPRHLVEIGSFLIDAEPVSTTSYCRFLNSVGVLAPEVLADWFVLDPSDDRNQHMLVYCTGNEWRPIERAERWPMILVSWYGANAYSLWANGCDWRQYRDDAGVQGGSYLPTEAQWEYAARGAQFRTFPWGNDEPHQKRMRFAQHTHSTTYEVDELPMADVNEELGMSPFGLHHMAGNVWQWCRDWYAEDFYKTPDSTQRNPFNRHPTQVRSERGGSWVGPGELCRSSYRRGRVPDARGRCLGFRCVSSIPS